MIYRTRCFVYNFIIHRKEVKQIKMFYLQSIINNENYDLQTNKMKLSLLWNYKTIEVTM